MPDLMNQYGGTEAFQEQYPILKIAKQGSTKMKKELVSAVSQLAIEAPLFVDACVIPYSWKILYNHTGTTSMRFILKRLRPAHAAELLNRIAIERMMSKHRSKDPFVNATDWEKAGHLMKQICELALDIVYPPDESIVPWTLTEEELERVRHLAYILDVDREDLEYSSQKICPNTHSTISRNVPNPHEEFWKAVVRLFLAQRNSETGKTFGATDMRSGDLVKLGLKRHAEYGMIIPIAEQEVTR
jgi:hypothetical protein